MRFFPIERFNEKITRSAAFGWIALVGAFHFVCLGLMFQRPFSTLPLSWKQLLPYAFSTLPPATRTMKEGQGRVVEWHQQAY